MRFGERGDLIIGSGDCDVFRKVSIMHSIILNENN